MYCILEICEIVLASPRPGAGAEGNSARAMETPSQCECDSGVDTSIKRQRIGLHCA
jgi:hypothetical protein